MSQRIIDGRRRLPGDCDQLRPAGDEWLHRSTIYRVYGVDTPALNPGHKRKQLSEFGLSTIAEGIEDAECAALLVQFGFEQGAKAFTSSIPWPIARQVNELCVGLAQPSWLRRPS